METIGAYEAKTHLPHWLDEVVAGRSLVITRHGQPVARLVPAQPGSASRATVIDKLRQARHGTRLEGDSLREMISEGRR